MEKKWICKWLNKNFNYNLERVRVILYNKIGGEVMGEKYVWSRWKKVIIEKWLIVTLHISKFLLSYRYFLDIIDIKN